ncbi:hypothetical protein ABBQ38_004243 [Trebouxia sp. C0009 RCD-2024]
MWQRLYCREGSMSSMPGEGLPLDPRGGASVVLVMSQVQTPDLIAGKPSGSCTGPLLYARPQRYDVQITVAVAIQVAGTVIGVITGEHGY